MRVLIALAFITVFCFSAMADDGNVIGVERANVATGIFQKTCFLNFRDKSKAEALLNEKFQKHDSDKKRLFLDFTKTEEGDVWIAVFPKGIFAIVLAENGNCHVIAQKADRDKIHENIKDLAKKSPKNSNMNVEPYSVSMGSATKSSGFNVVGQDNKNAMIIVASTPIQQGENKPDAIITMAVQAY